MIIGHQRRPRLTPTARAAPQTPIANAAPIKTSIASTGFVTVIGAVSVVLACYRQGKRAPRSTAAPRNAARCRTGKGPLRSATCSHPAPDRAAGPLRAADLAGA